MSARLVWVACALSTCWGAEISGSVTASKGLVLNGKEIPVAGTKSWPVRAGDEIRSAGASIVLTMKDGSKVILGAHSQVRLEDAGLTGVVRLVSGAIRYDLTPESQLKVAVRGETLTARSGQGSTTAATPVMGSPALATDPDPISRRRP